MKRCDVCDINPAGPNGEICSECTMVALRAYGWAQGHANASGVLQRGPEDAAARAELDALTDKARGRRTGPTTTESDVETFNGAGGTFLVGKSKDGSTKWIEHVTCGMRSYHPKDVEHMYCAKCDHGLHEPPMEDR